MRIFFTNDDDKCSYNNRRMKKNHEMLFRVGSSIFIQALDFNFPIKNDTAVESVRCVQYVLQYKYVG